MWVQKRKYILHQVADDSVPFACHRMSGPVLPVGHQLEDELEAHFIGDEAEYVNAESVKPAVSGSVLLFVHHYVRPFLGNALT